MLTLERSSDPTTEPLTLSETRDHLRVDVSDDDELIDGLITAARQHVEEVTRRALVTQTWKLYLDDFPVSRLIDLPWSEYMRLPERAILLPRPPVQSVTSIAYVDTGGTTQTLASSKFRTDLVSEPARITEAEGETWPTTDNVTNAVTITYTAGYGANANDVPRALRQAMLLMIGHWYENRESVSVGAMGEVPVASDALLSPYRVFV